MEKALFLNSYYCRDCDHNWQDDGEKDAHSNCPNCGVNWEPYDSTENNCVLENYTVTKFCTNCRHCVSKVIDFGESQFFYDRDKSMPKERFQDDNEMKKAFKKWAKKENNKVDEFGHCSFHCLIGE